MRSAVPRPRTPTVPDPAPSARLQLPPRTRGARRGSAQLRRPVRLRCPRDAAPRGEGGRRARVAVCLRAYVSGCGRCIGVTRLGVSLLVLPINNPLGDHGNFFSGWKDENRVSTQNFELETECPKSRAKPYQQPWPFEPSIPFLC